MGEAIVFSIISILAFLGIQKLFELFENIKAGGGERPTVLVYKLSGHEQDAEMIVRSLVSDSVKISTGRQVAVFIVNDSMDDETYDVCVRTAQQYKNVFVGSFDEASNLLDT